MVLESGDFIWVCCICGTTCFQAESLHASLQPGSNAQSQVTNLSERFVMEMLTDP